MVTVVLFAFLFVNIFILGRSIKHIIATIIIFKTIVIFVIVLSTHITPKYITNMFRTMFVTSKPTIIIIIIVTIVTITSTFITTTTTTTTSAITTNTTTLTNH